MKDILVVPTPNLKQPTQTLVGERYEVIDYAEAKPQRIKDKKILYWPTQAKGSKEKAEKLAKYTDETKLVVAQDGFDAVKAIEQGWEWAQFKEWARARIAVIVVTQQPEEDIPKPTESQRVAIERLGLALSETTGAPICDIANVSLFLERSEWVGHVWFDDFHYKYFTDKAGRSKEWTDTDTLNLTGYLQSELGFRRIRDDIVLKGIYLHASKNVRNEPKDWLNSLEWDGTPRIADFFVECLGAECTAYTVAASHNFWVGMIARLMNPGCQMDNMVVLEGSQGTYKTSVLRVIGGKWYTEISGDIRSKQFLMLLHGKILIEIAELDAFSRAEASAIKALITRTEDNFVLPYGKIASIFPRTSIFVGTTNHDDYLIDDSGGRRFWPIKTGKINLQLVKDTREQLFAEAHQLFADGAKWWLMPGDETKQIQESRRFYDEWEGILKTALNGSFMVTVHEASKYLNMSNDKLTKSDQKRIASCLKALGFKKDRAMIEGVQTRCWIKNGLDHQKD